MHRRSCPVQTRHCGYEQGVHRVFQDEGCGGKINDARAAAKKELDDRLETLKKAMDEINKTNQEIEKPELSKDGKEKLAKQRDEKVQEARNLDREIASFARLASDSCRSSSCACARISSTTS